MAIVEINNLDDPSNVTVDEGQTKSCKKNLAPAIKIREVKKNKKYDSSSDTSDVQDVEPTKAKAKPNGQVKGKAKPTGNVSKTNSKSKKGPGKKQTGSSTKKSKRDTCHDDKANANVATVANERMGSTNPVNEIDAFNVLVSVH